MWKAIRCLALSSALALVSCASSTLLFEAAYRGDNAGVRAILARGANPNESPGRGGRR